MAGVNKVILIGRLGRDPEMRYTPDGTAIANFSIATSDEWRDKATGEKRERTEWHRIVAFRRLGEICGEYLSKGKQVYIEGRLRTRSWEKDGITRYTTEIEAQNMQMLSARDAAGPPQRPADNYGQQQNQYNQPPQQSNNYNQQPPPPQFPEGPDDDIPF